LDLIVVCTVTPEMAVPSTACLLQDRLGVSGRGIPAFDLGAGCSGFLYGLATAHAHMQVMGTRQILLVGVDVLSRMTDRSDRNTAVLLGDGAGAVVLRRTEDPTRGVLRTSIGADGSGHNLLYAPGGFNREQLPGLGPLTCDYYLRMDGPKVFKLAVNRMRQQVEEAVAACGMLVEDIDMLIAHQANRRLLDAVAERLQLPAEKVYANIERYGNTSAASIPMAYDEARREGRIHDNDVVVMVAFGAGLTWGSAVIREGQGDCATKLLDVRREEGMGKRNDCGQAAERVATRGAAELPRLIGFATEIAQGWAQSLEVGDEKIVWVALEGHSRTPISSAAAEGIHQLENGTGIAFVLGCTGVMDLLFVVSGRGETYSVNISNHAKPWERSEHLRLHLDHAGDRNRVLAVATRYARRGAS
jgi:3-oxoacyl-[acyl-carrier-protein] synthase-3